MIPSQLALKDGAHFSGLSPNYQREVAYGEVVFSTGMTGYEESLTDPSYAGQILTFTYPLIGNYGVPSEDTWESKRVAAQGVVVSEACTHWSHQRGLRSLMKWCKEQDLPIITDVDTRALTKHLRVAGSIPGAITLRGEADLEFTDPNSQHLVKRVSTPEIPAPEGKGKRVVVVDCGMKENILRCLRKLPVEIQRVPYDYDYTEEEYDGVFLSNGPGDPVQCAETVAILKKALKKEKPVFGICLGTQLLSLAAGAKTYKLKYGHRGHNQPCIDTETNRCYITSQNHGFAIEESSLPDDWTVSFRNLNDDSIEGIRHSTLPFSAVQFHPEAAPGPTDTHWLFEAFAEQL